MEMEDRFIGKLGCQLESSPKELIISQTNEEQLRQQAKEKDIHLLQHGIPESILFSILSPRTRPQFQHCHQKRLSC